MHASFRRFVPLFIVTTALAACERAPVAERSEPQPEVVPVTAAPVEPAPPPPAPSQSADVPTAEADRLPLVQILAIAQRRIPGEVLKVDIDDDDDDDAPTYELEILTPEGRVIEIRLDARTGDVLEIEED